MNCLKQSCFCCRSDLISCLYWCGLFIIFSLCFYSCVFFIFSLLSFFRGNSDILSCLSLFVNNFFSAIYSVGAQYHLALSDQNCSARVSFVIIPPSSNFVNQKLQIKLYSDNLCCILKLLYHAFYFSHNIRNSYNIAYA